MMKLIFIFLSVMLLSAPLLAQDIITDRPDQTESSRAVGKGMFQIESGLLAEFLGSDSSKSKRYLIPTNLFRVGISKKMEIRVVSQFESRHPSGNENGSGGKLGLSNLELGTKVELFRKESVNMEIAFLSHVVIPSGSFDADRENWGSINRILIAHDLGDKASVGYNLGYNYFGEGHGDFTYTLAFNFALGRYLGLYLEPYGSILDLDVHEASFDAGFTYLVQDNIQLDWSFGTGLNYQMNYLSAGLSILLDGNKRSVDKNMR